MLVSGTGTILAALIGEGVEVEMVLADRACPALERASRAGIRAVLVDRKSFGGFGSGFDRAAYTQQVVSELERGNIDLVVMAGFGTVLSEAVHLAYPHRVINTHPALLPAYPGWHAVEDALSDGAEVTGCTVHLAELDVDSGPVLARQEVRVERGDSVESLHERIKATERVLVPAVVARVCRAIERGDDPALLPALEGTVKEPLEAVKRVRADEYEAAAPKVKV